jgi:hypothetical protein
MGASEDLERKARFAAFYAANVPKFRIQIGFWTGSKLRLRDNSRFCFIVPTFYSNINIVVVLIWYCH